MTSSTKSIAIDLLEIAEVNLLNSILKIRPEDVHKQVLPEFNTISWILGHCFSHFHMVLCDTCQEKEMISKEVGHHFRYGTTKEEIAKSGSPLKFLQLVDEYLHLSADGFAYLQTLEDEDFGKVIFPEINETLLHSIERIAFHYMGHMGQIVLLRHALGNPGPSFVGGAKESSRKKMRDEWNSWWSENKGNFKN
jgi:hypothetical protein